MTRKLILYIFINICLITSYAQSITVDPEVICAGENAYLATDTNVNYVHIGDILCFLDDDTANYIIVRPEVWEQYADEGYTPLSVVFYVDQTGKHGWAVQAVQAASAYAQLKWYNFINPTTTPYQIPTGLTTKAGNGRDPLTDLNGAHNTSCILAMQTRTYYLAANSISSPFYLPAIGQVGYLYTKVLLVNPVLNQLGMATLPLLISNTWSSTGVTGTPATAYMCVTTGAIQPIAKTAQLNVIPVMNF